MKQNLTIVTFNEHNECENQDGVKPNSIIYCGLISDIEEQFLLEVIKDIRAIDENFVCIYKI